METAPKDGTPILTANKENIVSAKWYLSGFENRGYWATVPGRFNAEPIAWMPLPEPPTLALNATVMGAKMAEARKDAHPLSCKCARCVCEISHLFDVALKGAIEVAYSKPK